MWFEMGKKRFNEGMLCLTGAYGREANEYDWETGSDFQIVSGPYCSIRNCAAIKADNGSDSMQLVFVNARGSVLFIKDI
jgi:hypothetical protein